MDMIVEPTGRVRAIYSEEIDLSQFGHPKISRASHVEPGPDGRWHADLSPVGGPVLGPFDRRSSCPRITSPIRAMAMRVDRVVQLGSHGAPLQPHSGLFLSGCTPPRRVVLPVHARTAMEARFRPSRADVLQDRLVTDQGLAAPVLADRAKHPVLDRVPLTRPRRVVRHGQDQPELIGQPLQPAFHPHFRWSLAPPPSTSISNRFASG